MAPKELTPDEEKKGLKLDSPAVRNRIVNAALERLKKSKPAAFFTPEAAELVTVGNLEDNFEWVGEGDWIVEAIVEQLRPKQELFARIERVRRPGSIVSSNTSGLPIASIAAETSAEFKAHFLGTHFFNPPRYMKLLEVIPAAETKPEVVEFMTDFAARRLGKGVVVCKDTPNFIANRLGSVLGASDPRVRFSERVHGRRGRRYFEPAHRAAEDGALSSARPRRVRRVQLGRR